MRDRWIAETIMTANSLQIRNGAISRERLITLSDRLRIANLHKKELNFKLVVIGDFGVGKCVETSPIGSFEFGLFSRQNFDY